MCILLHVLDAHRRAAHPAQCRAGAHLAGLEGVAGAWHRLAAPCPFPGQALGHAGAAPGRPSGQRLADPAPHRSAGAVAVAGRLGPDAARRLGPRLRRRALQPCGCTCHLRRTVRCLRAGRRPEAAALGRGGAPPGCWRYPGARGRRARVRVVQSARAACRRRCPGRRRGHCVRCAVRGAWIPPRKPTRASICACSRELCRDLLLLVEAGLQQLRRPGRADRHHAHRAGRTPALDQ